MDSTPSGYGLGMSRKPLSDKGPQRSGPPVSHTCTDGATRSSNHRNHLDQILSDLETELLRLSQQPAGEQDFERLEGELHQLFAAAERAPLAHELERLDVDRPEVR